MDAASTIEYKGLHWGPLYSMRVRGLFPASGTDAGASWTGAMNCFIAPACERASACKRERGLQGRFPLVGAACKADSHPLATIKSRS